MYHILFSTGLSFLITFFSIPVIIQVAKEKKLFDEPDERKIHKTVIPTLGGLGIFAGFIIAVLLGIPKGQLPELQYFGAACIVVFFLGIKDDILVLSANKKLIGQLFAAIILIKFGGVEINNMHGFLGVYAIPRIAAILLTIFTIVVITNSFNLIDGVDGLAGTLGIFTTLIFGCYFLYMGQENYALLAFSLAGSLFSFLIYNFPPAKVFMGDTGSLLVGLLNAIFVIKFINMSQESNALFQIKSAPAIGFAILIVPLFDTLRVFSYRIFNQRSPFSPDRTHIHHLLLDLGLSHKKITLYCISANILLLAIALVLSNFGTTIVLGVLFLTCAFITSFIFYLNRKDKSYMVEETSNQEVIKSHTTLSFSSKTAETE